MARRPKVICGAYGRVTNAFKLHDTYGIPLWMVYERGLEPDLEQFRLDARKAGWSERHIEGVIRDAETYRRDSQ